MGQGTTENMAVLGMSAGKDRFAARAGMEGRDFQARKKNTLRPGGPRPPGKVAIVTRHSQEREKRQMPPLEGLCSTASSGRGPGPPGAPGPRQVCGRSGLMLRQR